jgi:hypothetical protein
LFKGAFLVPASGLGGGDLGAGGSENAISKTLISFVFEKFLNCAKKDI